MNMPKMVKIRHLFNKDRIENPRETVLLKLRESGLLSRIKSGSRIAVTAGSRGIAGIPVILRAVVDELKRAGAEPFIVPAMGSHGGGTAEGQLEMLESLGITEKTVNAPVISSIETVELGITQSGAPAYMDKNAYDSDGIVVVNRVKLHTAFHGRIESGLCKMVAVGLGKREGAETGHRLGLGEVIVECFRLAQKKVNIILGVAILENSRDETLDIRVVTPEDFESADSELLERCRNILPRIPVSGFDILIVDEMGKNISGTGMDTNVIGFWRRFGGEKDPDYKTLIVLSLTPESRGNAMGIGLADLTTRRLVDSIDYNSTNANAITSQWALGRIPITLENDRECLRIALEKHDPGTARLVRIKNTLDLEELSVSENLAPSLKTRDDIEIIGAPAPMKFDSEGFFE